MRSFLSVAGLFILLTAIEAAPARADTRVFRPDGTLQCGMGQEVPLEADKAVLEGLGARVISSEKRELPMLISQVCGASTGRVNTFVISDADWSKVLRGFVGPMGFARWVFDRPDVEVYKYDGTLQCGLGKAVAPDEMAQQLTSAGIEVIHARADTDGLLHMALCGASTGAINVFDIPSTSFEAARALGFDYFQSRLAAARDAAAMKADGAPSKSLDLAKPASVDNGPEVPFPF